MPSICLSCIIYTIYDKQIEENKYDFIYNISLEVIKKSLKKYKKYLPDGFLINY